MKNLAQILIFLLFPLGLEAQQIITASSGPVALFETINASVTSGNVKQALDDFDKVVEYCLLQGKERELPERYFGMALSLAMNGHYKESIRYHKKAIRLHRQYQKNEPTEMFLNLGLTYYLAGKNKQARRILGDSI